jgi:putative two-component system response regulator
MAADQTPYSNPLPSKQVTLLIVDDEKLYLDVLVDVLKPHYRTIIAKNGQQALQRLHDHPYLVDLILLDVIMPTMNGYETCQKIKDNVATRDIPVIFITAKTEEHDEAIGFQVGAVDYITKPINPLLLQTRVKTQLELKAARDLLKQQNEQLEEKVLARTRQLEELQNVAMVAMGSLAETRDPETGNHIRRTQNYVKRLALQLQHHSKFSQWLTPDIINMLYKSAPLHDIGKVGVPDYILLKPGRLTTEEFEQMKKHTVYGRDAIIAAEQEMNHNDNFLKFAKEIAYCHQEKWDGSGYPEGLAGQAIPLSARIMAIADVYDALISRRVYKPALPHAQAVEIIQQGRNTHFDPDLVDAFLDIADEFQRIAENYHDA